MIGKDNMTTEKEPWIIKEVCIHPNAMSERKWREAIKMGFNSATKQQVWWKTTKDAP